MQLNGQNKYRVREVDASDHEDTLKRLHDATFENCEKPALPDNFWWLAWDAQKEPVAFASMRLSEVKANAGFLSRCGVLPEHRGHGLQRRLLRAREAKARRLGWKWIHTDTTENPATSNSLIRCGYTLFEPKYPWGFKNSLYWRKRLRTEKEV